MGARFEGFSYGGDIGKRGKLKIELTSSNAGLAGTHRIAKVLAFK